MTAVVCNIEGEKVLVVDEIQIYSSNTKEQLNDIKSEELDRIFVKGKKELVTIYKPEANLMEGYDFTSKKKVTTNSKKDNKK